MSMPCKWDCDGWPTYCTCRLQYGKTTTTTTTSTTLWWQPYYGEESIETPLKPQEQMLFQFLDRIERHLQYLRDRAREGE